MACFVVNDRTLLEYLDRAGEPLWGGHLQRGEPITDSDMRRWLACGWIEAVGTKGYVLTEIGRAAIKLLDIETGAPK